MGMMYNPDNGLPRMQVMVTGAAGFIGSTLLQEWGAPGSPIQPRYGVDTFGSGDKWRNVRTCLDTLWLTPEEAYADFMSGGLRPQAVVHLGAISSTTATDVDAVLDTNYRLTLRLWRRCQQLGIPFVYASSASVYGRSGSFSDTCLPIPEAEPLNPYAWSKLLTDSEITAESYGFTRCRALTVGLRFFNVFGLNESHKGSQASVFHQFTHSLLTKGRVTVYDANPVLAATNSIGSYQRDFVDVYDCVDVITHALTSPGMPSGIFNVGSGVATSFAEIAAAIVRRLRPDVADPFSLIDFEALPDTLRPHYQPYTCASLHSLRRAGYLGDMRKWHNSLYILDQISKTHIS